MDGFLKKIKIHPKKAVFNYIFQCILHSSAFKCIQMHSSALKCTQVHSSALKCIQVHSSAFKCIQVHSSAFKRIQAHSSAFKRITDPQSFKGKRQNVVTYISCYRCQRCFLTTVCRWIYFVSKFT